jgi:hypothetical protein
LDKLRSSKPANLNPPRARCQSGTPAIDVQLTNARRDLSIRKDLEDLLAVSQDVTVLVVEFELQIVYATAVIIDQVHVLTARHNAVLPKSGDALKRIWILPLRQECVHYRQILDDEVFSLDCIVVENLYKKTTRPTDALNLALICIQTSTPLLTLSPGIMSLSFEVPPLGSIVDVIGYPGKIDESSLRRANVNDIAYNMTLVDRLLPANSLSISRATVMESRSGLISYNASTRPGLSGACVVFNNKVVGGSCFYF